MRVRLASLHDPLERMLMVCRFCGQDEEHDPGEEFEEYLACSVCGDNGKFRSSFGVCCKLQHLLEYQ
jgi:hypothetical protein